jgi:hypothetical protein
MHSERGTVNTFDTVSKRHLQQIAFEKNLPDTPQSGGYSTSLRSALAEL